MSELWRAKTPDKRLEDNWDVISDILPYVRLYKTLTQEQLLELLRDAKHLRWEALDLHCCGLDRLPEELGDLSDLHFLDIGNSFWAKKWDYDYFERCGNYNCFPSIPDYISNLTNLRQLYLTNIRITALPDSIGNLANLRTLNVSNTQLTALPDSIGNLTNLQELNVYHTQLTALPDSIGNLINLKKLVLSANHHLTTLPDSIGNLINLQKLDLFRIQFTTLPDSIGNLSNLQILYAPECAITTLPDSIGNLTSLHTLDLCWAKLVTLPDSIGNLTNLHTLNLTNTKLVTLPDSIGNLTSLHTLDLHDTKLVTLPDSIGNLTSLHTLDLNSSELVTLPDSISNLANLCILDLSETNLNTLPDTISNLPNLKTLNLRRCHIPTIPYSLVQLDLPFNISHYHEENCINLFDITLDEGDISLFNQPREVIEEYYRNRITETASECKVIFLGDGAAGKTSLVERMVNDTFEEGSLPTDGVKMTRWTAWPDKDKTPLKLNGKPLVLRLMDFGGQEIMHAMHRCFLTTHTVYVIVCESRNDGDIDSVARRWVETVQSFAPDCPVILALNKSDLNIQVTVNETALRKSNPNFMGAIRSYAKVDGDPGVRQLVDYIFKAVPDCLSQMTGNKGFLGLKQELEEMEEDYILPEKFRERCNHFEIKETVRTDLLNWFRDLGVAYPYVVTFREVYVLNPAWLTNGIYRLILRTPPTGFLPHSVIRETLGTGYANDVNPYKTYTPQEMDFILHVMRQFEISLCVTPEYAPDGVEMVPMKMEKNTPERVEGFPYASALHLRWEAPYLPNTLVHRLMIRRHEDLDMDCVWRTGGWFHRYDGGCELLAVMSDRALDVYASGSDARGYMNTYREQILRILGELNITAEEFVYCTVNGKTGRIPFQHVLARRRKGKKEIYLGDIDEDVPVDWILRENYVEKPAHAEKPVGTKRPVSAEMETRDFFISYNNDHDGVRARWIANTLRTNGLTVFFQEYDCKPGMDFLRWMEDAISHSKGFLAVWSGAYEASDYCRKELHAATVRQHDDSSYLLLPVRVEDVPVQNPLFQSIVRVDLLSDEETNRDRLLSAAGQVRQG